MRQRTLSEKEADVLSWVEKGPIHYTVIALNTKMPKSTVNDILHRLERMDKIKSFKILQDKVGPPLRMWEMKDQREA